MDDFFDFCLGVFVVACIVKLLGLTLEEWNKLSPKQQQKLVKSILGKQKSLTQPVQVVKGTSLTVIESSCDRPAFKVRKVQKRDFGLCKLDGGLCLWDDCFCRRTEVCTVEINFACEWYTENTWLNRYRLRKKRGDA